METGGNYSSNFGLINNSSPCSKGDLKLIRRKKHTFLSRVNKNKKSFQLSILVALLNKYCCFVIERPKKRSQITHHLFKIKEIIFDNETLDVEDFLQKRCLHLLKKEIDNGGSMECALRRIEKEKMNALFELLMDIANEYGYFFETVKMRKKSVRSNVDFIEKIYYNNKLIFNSDIICEKGAIVSDYLLSLICGGNDSYTVQKSVLFDVANN
ncbi:TATA-binding protein-associated phosphoprotein [Entamoeba marina]